MTIKLASKQNGIYGLKVDSVVSPLTEETLQYILNDKFYDDKGIYKNDDKYIVMLQNGTKFSISDKDNFLSKLSKAHCDVSASDDISSFEVD
jgi:hypothetical protein